MSEEPEETIFSKAIAVLEQALKDRQAKKLSKHVLEERARSARREEVHRAEMTREFLAGEWWNQYMRPMVNAEIALNPISEGETLTTEEVANRQLLASGRAHLSQRMLRRFAEWIRVGDEAAKKLSADREAQEALKNL